jgi:FlaA1/EpsC-like NDP-sugar epimerase
MNTALNINIFNILIAVGAIQGLIFTLVVIFNPKYKANSNIYLAFLIAFKLRFGDTIPTKNYNAYMDLIPYISIFAVLLFQMYNLYTNQLKRRIDEIFYTFIPATFIIVLFVGTLTYLTHSLAFPRSVFLISFPVLFVTMIAWRYLVLALERLISKKEDIIIVGRG